MAEPADRGAGVAEAVFRDPQGGLVRALHAFRRTPAVCVTVTVPSDGDGGGASCVADVARTCTAAFGLRVVTDARELYELHLPPQASGDGRVVLAYGATHNTTCVVLEPCEAAAPVTAGAGAASAPPPPPLAAPPAGPPPVLTLLVPDIGAAYAGVLAAGWPASPFYPGSATSTSFTAMEPRSGALLQVAPMSA